MSKVFNRTAVSILSLVLASNQLMASRQSIDNKNSEPAQPRVQILEDGYDNTVLVAPSDLAMVSAPSRNNNLEMVSFEPSNELSLVRGDAAPTYLTLTHLLKLRKICQILTQPDAIAAINNIFTNIAYEESNKLYAQHGSKFLEPFMHSMGTGVCGLIEQTLLQAAGISPLVKHMKTLTGIRFTMKNHMSETLASKLPQSVSGALNAVPNFINKKLVGPYVVAPSVATVVDQIKFGEILSTQGFEKLLNYLKAHQDELVNRSRTSIEEISNQITQLQAELDKYANFLVNECIEIEAKLKAKLAEIKPKQDAVDQKGNSFFNVWNTEPEEVINLRKEIAELEDQNRAFEAEKTKLQDQQKQHNSEIADLQTKIDDLKKASAQHIAEISEAGLALADNTSLKAYMGLLCKLSINGYTLSAYLDACEHIQPSRLSSLVSSHMTMKNGQVAARGLAIIPHSILYYSGTLEALRKLHGKHLNPDLLLALIQETVANLNKKMESDLSAELHQLATRTIIGSLRVSIPTILHGARELVNSDLSPVDVLLNTGAAVASNFADKAQQEVKQELMEVAGPLVRHGQVLIQDAQEAYTSLNWIRHGTNVVIYTATYTPVVAAAGYFANFFIDYSISTTGAIGYGFLLAVITDRLN